MPGEVLISSTPSAAWLPPGSTAEAWAGSDCAVPEPCIIVRLLVVRPAESGAPEFFVVPTSRGLDLPTLRIESGRRRPSTSEALSTLAGRVHGRPGVRHRCVGYIRNVVPSPDDTYPHPVPWAHVPVFAPGEAVQPVCEGTWLGVGRARDALSVRHWWPIVEHHLGGRPAAGLLDAPQRRPVDGPG